MFHEEVFIVRRTSRYFAEADNPPCDGVKWEPTIGNGSGAWTIRFGTLNQLLEFVDTHKCVVIDTATDDGIRVLEIYDDYRE